MILFKLIDGVPQVSSKVVFGDYWLHYLGVKNVAGVAKGFAQVSFEQSLVFFVLAGVIISALFNAVGSLLKYTADPLDKLPAITYWLMGSFTSASYKKIMVGSPLILAGIAVI